MNISRRIKLSLVAFLTAAVIIFSCQKNLSVNKTDQQSIQSARGWFDSISKANPQIWRTNQYYLDWINTTTFFSSKGEKYLVVPYKNLIHLDNIQMVLSRQLLVKQGNNGKSTEGYVLETVSDEPFLNLHKTSLASNFINKTFIGFTGAAILWDISYRPVCSGRFLNGTDVGTASINASKKRDNVSSQKITTNGVGYQTASAPAPPPNCAEWTDWYYCGYYSDGTLASYRYITTTCDVETTAPNGNEGWANSIGTTNSPSISSAILTDTSITNSSVKCLFDSIKETLHVILASFDNNKYNITFKLGNMGMDTLGTTSPVFASGGKDYVITINSNNALDPYYSKIYLAKTIIHEAFHAKLRQKAIELIGSSNIATWPKNIDDMTLQELSGYFYTETVNNQTWNAIAHDWMVNNISSCAHYLQNFVQKYYPNDYNLPNGSDPDTYIAFFYQGLQNSSYFSTCLQDKGWTADSLNKRILEAPFGSSNCPGALSPAENP